MCFKGESDNSSSCDKKRASNCKKQLQESEFATDEKRIYGQGIRNTAMRDFEKVVF